MSKVISPSVRETAFTCPHCSALTTQFWHRLYGEPINEEPRTPLSADAELKKGLADADLTSKDKQLLLELHNTINTGLIFFRNQEVRQGMRAYNLHLTKCFNCKKIAMWVHDRLLFPPAKEGPPPNKDLPNEILRDYDEAREIVNASPRGAAALLRLCIQKLCRQLGEKGKSIDDDIASLVKKGLDPIIQQSLDIVRVIGNEAVHPGVMDLKDNRDTAILLFDLVNSVADQTITRPKTVREMYAKLPEEKRKAIEARDKKLTETATS